MSLFGKKTAKSKNITPISEESVKAKPLGKAPIVSKRVTKPAVHIIRPLVSEKAMALSENNTYVFLVDPRTNKSEVRKEIENLYKVNVIMITASKYHQKPRHFRGLASSQKLMKKAMVTLKSGQKIEIFNK
jgi:large subunit ribosomal protein L23